MILHLVEDEKVVNRMINNFDAAKPGENIYVCMCRKSSHAYKPKFIDESLPVTYYDYRYDKCEFDLSKCDLVLIHYLTYQKALFVNKYIGRSIRICWIVWGGDMYGLLEQESGYQLFATNNSYRKKLTFKSIVKHLTGIEYKRKYITKKFVEERIKEIVGFEEDKKLLESCFKIKIDKVYTFCYYPIEQILGDKLLHESVNQESYNILCGNSASYTGNHEYLLDILKGLDLTKWTVTMPLSYGGDKEYVSIVENKGKSLLGSSFNALKKFVPLQEYNQLMIRSSVCIYGHWREEAFGNILVALYLGAKVFISNRNQFLKGLSEMGFKVFELEKITQNMLETPLSHDDKIKNRRLCMDLYSSQMIPQYISKIVNG